MNKKIIIPLLLSFFFGIVVAFPVAFNLGEKRERNKNASQKSISEQFLEQSWEIIEGNYWKKLSEKELSQLFLRGGEKTLRKEISVKSYNKGEVLGKLSKEADKLPQKEREKFLENLLTIILANLEPFGRNHLYTKEKEKNLAKEVNNVTKSNYYQMLGVSQKATLKEIKNAFQKKEKEAKTENEKENLEKAYQTLANSETRKRYDLAAISSSVFYKLINPQTLYLKITRITPYTLEDLNNAAQKFQGEEPHALIIDLRNNIGGSFDSLPYLLGPFIGKGQPAFQIFHQGKAITYTTKTSFLPSLFQYKQVVVLVNRNTQSSAEVLASVLKKYNVGVLLGEKTRGWGTVERVFPLSVQINSSKNYALFLVHSLTLREDGKPIEGNGIEPLVQLKSKNWQKKIAKYFNNKELIRALEKVIKNEG